MKILFIAVFNQTSTNISQLRSLRKLGVDVEAFDYRDNLKKYGYDAMSYTLLELCRGFNWVLIAKGESFSCRLLAEIKKEAKIAYWWPDPLSSLSTVYMDKLDLYDVIFCDKLQVYNFLKRDNCYIVYEGYDQDIDKPYKVYKDIDVGFIGTLYGNRSRIINSVKIPVFTAYGKEHAYIVSRTKVNINICTNGDASDRVYKIMASGGFLLTDDWVGRDNLFVDGKDLVIWNSVDDLRQKINYFLEHDVERAKIAHSGLKKVYPYSRLGWAQRIIDILRQM